MTVAAPATAVDDARWHDLEPFDRVIEATDQVLLIAATGGAKSTLVATMTLSVPSLVAIDEKGSLRLPNSRLVELPPYADIVSKETPGAYFDKVREAIRWREREPNRVVLRVHVLDIENYEAHNDIFHAVFLRTHTILWIDEITATGATPLRSQPWLRGLSSRGRTQAKVGIWTCTQAPFGLTPPILRRNANYIIVGPLDSEDIGDIRRTNIEIAETIPRKSGRFIVYASGERTPYRLYLPIPDRLKGWRAP